MNVAFCAYRDWAKPVIDTVKRHPKVSSVVHIANNEELEFYLGINKVTSMVSSHVEKTRPPLVDVVLFCGWSTPPTEEMVNKGVPMFSEHPATSDRYSPGTPLQNQILDGITRTKHRLVKVGFPELSPRTWSHEVDMELSGNMDDILDQMQATSRVLFTRFLDDYPEIEWHTWPELPTQDQVPRRTPEMSQITLEEVNNLSTKELYNRLRCLESPYPNAYIEDQYGKLFIERVRFQAK